MTRNERIRDYVQKARWLVRDATRYHTVQVAPGHSCVSPFVTIDGQGRDTLMDLLLKIEQETCGVRTTP